MRPTRPDPRAPAAPAAPVARRADVRRVSVAVVLCALVACGEADAPDPAPAPAADPPLGMVLDAGTWAGAAAVDITPAIKDTFEDLNGDGYWEEDEPWTDVDGDGTFDPVWIGGFGPQRPALEVHDPVWARALVLSHDGEYVAFVALDLVGLGTPRIHEARDGLAADGFDGDRLVVSSSHNHQGPDTMGLWGIPLAGVSGADPAYQERVAAAIEEAVRQAAAAMRPVDLTVGRTAMRDRGPWFSGATFGGKNPVDKLHGMVYDGRDPVVVSDQLLVLQGASDGETVFTLTSWSGHPETRGGDNNAISSDWVGVTREVLEDRYGGVALHLPECLGGMQSALGGDLPLVQPDGTHVFQTCTAEHVANPDDPDCYGLEAGAPRVDADGDAVPEWAPRSSWEFVTSHGWHIAEAAIDALEAGEPAGAAPIRVDWEPLYVPIENVAYQLLGPMGIFELGLDDAVYDPVLCDHDGAAQGCLETRTGRVQVGPMGFLTIPGEVLPELAWGFPEDPRWAAEAADPGARGPGAAFFPQHDPDCDGIDYADCTVETELGDCDCLAVHAWPYRLGDDPAVGPLLDGLDTEYRAVIGMADNYLSYVIPEPDFNRAVSLLSDRDGDHYEDTVSPAHDFATRLQRAQSALTERW